MFLILEGRAEVRSINSSGQKRIWAELTTGEIFGEVAFTSKIVRTADVVAVTDGNVLAFRREGLERSMRFYPGLAAKLFLNISRILGERLGSAIRSAEDLQKGPPNSVVEPEEQ